MSYTTASRTNIIEYLKNNSNRGITVSDIKDHLKDHGHDVNVTTIYRYLDKLVEDEQVVKYVAEKGKKATFQYVEEGHHCDSHLHLKCLKCGKITHLECDFMSEIAKHIERHHGFEVECKQSIIYGTCRECQQNCNMEDENI